MVSFPESRIHDDVCQCLKDSLRQGSVATAFAHFELKPSVSCFSPSSSLASLPYLSYGYFAFAKPSHYTHYTTHPSLAAVCILNFYDII